jgi:hypothetical protein
MIGRGATGAAGRGAAAILLCGLATGCGLLSNDPSLPVYTMEVYLSDNLLLTFTRTEQSAKGAWIPARPAFAGWVQTP